MLNYIWLALLLLGIGTALSLDIVDQVNNKYKNGKTMQCELILDKADELKSQKQFSAKIKVLADTFSKFYDYKINDDFQQSCRLTYDSKTKKYAVYFTVDNATPNFWKQMAKVNGKEEDLSGELAVQEKIDSLKYTAALRLEDISFVKMKEVTNAAIDYAKTAVNIALGLIGIMALWLGIMKIGEEAGLIKKLSNAVRPVTKFLFPDVPHDHPAIGSMLMNISANMLGLGNAATPFGLKAMEDLDTLNPNKGEATNAMCTFLVINTAGLTLIPATAIAVRAAAGSSDPAIIIGTSFFGASCATITGIISAKILEKFYIPNFSFINWFKRNVKLIITFAGVIFVLTALVITHSFSSITFLNVDFVKRFIQLFSVIAIPAIIIVFVVYAAVKKVKIYESFVEGAKEGFNVAVRIIPYLVAMLIAIGIFRAGGAMDFLVAAISPITNLIGMPAEALPMALMRPLSGSGSLGVMTEIISVHGPDSFIGILVSTIMGSTETTFYVLALYFGSVNIKKTRHAVAAGLLADAAGILGALFIVKLLFG
ncbi:nucleoside recognition domain-containing protein [Melioribacteraceae bacterium 4301-Me]|uniref:nucleoside recognition domain-containing protein n=1 Tax=Pyranulibacter aquaticus TaxID=3163344 RepID=UPI003599A193